MISGGQGSDKLLSHVPILTGDGDFVVLVDFDVERTGVGHSKGGESDDHGRELHEVLECK